MYVKLGDIEYKGLLGASSFDRERSVNYAQHDLINDIPRLQKTGARNLVSITILFSLHAGFCDPDTEIRRFEKKMYDGEVLPMVDGAGKSLGDFVIESLSDKPSKSNPLDGTPIAVDVTIQLKEYVFPKNYIRTPVGFALKSQTPDEVPVEPLVRLDEAEALAEVNLASGLIDSAGTDLNAAGKKTSGVVALLNQAKGKIEKVQKSYAKAYDAFDKASKKIQKAQETFTKVLQTAQNAVDRVESAKASIQYAQQNAQNGIALIQTAVANPSDPDAIKNAIAGGNRLSMSHRNVRAAASEGAYLTGAKKNWR